MNVRTLVALLLLLASSAEAAFAGTPGCINGLLLNPRAFVFYALNRQIGQPAADWEAVLQASGIPATSSVPGTGAGPAFYGITQWKGSGGNVRGRLSLPTMTPDALGYYTRSVDVLADNPAFSAKCWQDARACVWAWREEFAAPPYAPRQCSARPALTNDFDGDGRSDLTVFRPGSAVWYNLFANGGRRAVAWGAPSADVPAAGDYDGDGKTDIAVFRPSTGHWFRLRSAANNAPFDVLQWGGAGDIPVPADYDGDAIDDVAVYRPSTGIWYLKYSASGATGAAVWGVGSDIPMPGDYDGDGKADLVVYRPSTGVWYLWYSRTGTTGAMMWGGTPGDVPVPVDLDRDGALDLAIYRAAEGAWYVRFSSTAGVGRFSWGFSTDIPVPADYDGDNLTDLAVYRPSTGTWHILAMGNGVRYSFEWGIGSDWPLQ